MSRPLSLAHLTVLSLPPPQMVHTAAQIGYDYVGLRLVAVNDTTPGYPMMADAKLMRATKAALADSAVQVLDIEFIKITPDFQAANWEAFLDAGAEIGARHVITAPYDPDLGRMSDNLAAFAETAAKRGLSVVLEFFPWTVVPDLQSANAVVTATGRSDVGILVDMLHFDRSGSKSADFTGIPANRFPFAHLCDAPRLGTYSTDDLLFAGRAERLPPGMGMIDIKSILAHLPQNCPLTLEVPMTQATAAFGPEHVAKTCLQAAKAFLDPKS